MTKIIMLTSGGNTSTFMYNSVCDNFDISSVVMEERLSRLKIVKRRIKKLGFFKVIGQLLFQFTVCKLLSIFSRRRIQKIIEEYQLNTKPIPEDRIFSVPSVNSKECLEYLKEQKPDFIIVNGTRIISKKILNNIDAIFVNTHLGITPRYRGVHGAYWALANDDIENCGVTVHLVDTGIDTGGVLYQQNITPTRKDNFITYTYLQIGEGVQLMKKTISDFSIGKLSEIMPKTKDSHLWYHPTLHYYILKRFTKNVK